MKERFVDLISLKLLVFVGLFFFATLNLFDPLSATGFALGLAVALLGNWWSWDNLGKLAESEMTRRQAQQVALSGYLANFLLMLMAFGLGGFLALNIFAIGGGLALAKLAFAGEAFLRKVFVRA